MCQIHNAGNLVILPRHCMYNFWHARDNTGRGGGKEEKEHLRWGYARSKLTDISSQKHGDSLAMHSILSRMVHEYRLSHERDRTEVQYKIL